MFQTAISVEFAKLRKFTPLKIFLVIYMVLVPVFMYVASGFLDTFISPVMQAFFGNPAPKVWEFPEVWKFTFYSSSWFHILMGIVVIMVLSYEFSYKTAKQNVIDGLNRSQVIFGKLALILFLATFVTLYSFLVGLVFGLINSESYDIYTNSHFIFVFFFQALCYYSLALLFAILIRHTVLGIIAFSIFPVIDVIAGALVPKWLYAFFPLNVFSTMTPSPVRQALIIIEEKQNKQEILDLQLWALLACAIGFLFLFYVLSYVNIKRRDI